MTSASSDTTPGKSWPRTPFRRALAAFLAAAAFLCATRAEDASTVKLTALKDRVRVEIGGKLFTEYVYGDGASRSYCYPILAADGTPLTRNFPTKKVPGEDTDHPWQRSFWFAHSAVGGVDFWNEGTGDAGHASALKGHTVAENVSILNSEGRAKDRPAGDGKSGTVMATDRWLAPNGALICTDKRVVSFHGNASERYIDFQIDLQALPDAPLLLGDNKDGTMAVRLAQWMTMPHKFKGEQTGGDGHIVTAKGDRDAAAWGKRADWCDYHADHGGQTYGIAIFDHPENLRHPTWWMARDYGLFGANPFGEHEFENLKDQPHLGDYTIPAGGTLTLRYRFYFHLGDEVAANVAARYADYSAGE
jgi:hypothetical protein